MKADLTRLTFDPTKHYRGVHQQQGRVQLDSDANEQLDITAHRTETETIDTVGTCGAPLHADGFRLISAVAQLSPDEAARPGNKNPPALAAGDLLVTAGRFYAGGILCENDRIFALSAQPELPTAAQIASIAPNSVVPLKAPGTYLAYLDVWPRLRTAIDDPRIREVALGGPDTTVRTKNSWQVKLLAAPEGATCATALPEWDALVNPAPGTLAAKIVESASKPGPCIVDPGSGYRRLENQLYRVEVHTGGSSLAKATFKWSRDNGSIVTRWLAKQVGSDQLELETAGRDKVLNIAAGHWIELTDDAHEELGVPGSFAQVTLVQGNVVTIDAATAIGPVELANFPKNPKVRRWDSAPAAAGKWIAPDGQKSLNTTDWFELEDGVAVKFGAGTFRTGDYWLIPARTASPALDWPVVGTQPVAQPPHGILHRYCKLAIVEFKNGAFTISDCRPLFPPLTELTTLDYVSGDAQEATPDPTKPATTPLPLPHALKVGVSNGEWPVAGARVRFTVKVGGGALTPASGIVTTGPDGIASCNWAINHTVVNHEVEAELLDAANLRVHLPVIFHARTNLARQVGYDPAKCDGMKNANPPVVTVQDALDFLCQRHESAAECCVTIGRLGDRPGDYSTILEALEDLWKKQGRSSICLSLLPGEHRIDKALTIEPVDQKEPLHFKFCGCSRASRLVLEAPLVLANLRSATVRDLTVVMEGGLLAFERTELVEITHCDVGGAATDLQPLVAIGDAANIVLEHNRLGVARVKTGALGPQKLLAGEPTIAGLYQTKEADFEAKAVDVANELAALSATKRKAVVRTLADNLPTAANKLTAGERTSYEKLIDTIGEKEVDSAALARRLKEVRASASRALNALVLVLNDTDATATLAGNEFRGQVQVGRGKPGDPLNGDELARLTKLGKGGGINVRPARGILQFRGNHLTNLTLSGERLEELRKIVQTGKGEVEGWQAAFLTENVFEAGDNCIVARQFALTSARLSAQNSDAGAAVAAASFYFGNAAEDDFRWFDISPAVRPSPPGALSIGVNIV